MNEQCDRCGSLYETTTEEANMPAQNGESLGLECLGKRFVQAWRQENHENESRSRTDIEWISVNDRFPDPLKIVLLFYRNDAGKTRIIVGYWLPKHYEEANADSEVTEYDEATDTDYEAEGWYERTDNWQEYYSIQVTEGIVTHWMPLPNPPAK